MEVAAGGGEMTECESWMRAGGTARVRATSIPVGPSSLPPFPYKSLKRAVTLNKSDVGQEKNLPRFLVHDSSLPRQSISLSESRTHYLLLSLSPV